MEPFKIFERLYHQLLKLTTQLEQIAPDQSRQEEYVDGTWVQEQFNLSKQTLSDYRRRGVLPYTYFAERGKIYYRVSDIYALLDQNFNGRNMK